MKKCNDCEVNNFGWCMYYNESIDKIKECGKDKDWFWCPEGCDVL
jgi:hypothetical protein